MQLSHLLVKWFMLSLGASLYQIKEGQAITCDHENTKAIIL